VTIGKAEERALITGLHLVADLFCNKCDSYVGWKYIDAYEEKEKYKVGKFILERAKIKKNENWATSSNYSDEEEEGNEMTEEEEEFVELSEL
jgi:hypothetical protein